MELLSMLLLFILSTGVSFLAYAFGYTDGVEYENKRIRRKLRKAEKEGKLVFKNQK